MNRGQGDIALSVEKEKKYESSHTGSTNAKSKSAASGNERYGSEQIYLFEDAEYCSSWDGASKQLVNSNV